MQCKLTDDRLSVLRAAVDRLIPPDEFPSGWDTGVGNFISHLLQTDLRDSATDLLTGLDCLNDEAQRVTGRPFAELSAAEGDQLLTNVELAEVVSDWRVDPAAFMRALVELTAEGYYSDPGNGGNKDSISWKMIGYDPGANGPL